MTKFAYDGQDNLTQVTDPRNLETKTPRNGLGDMTQLQSPDTGTAQHTYDEAGNLKTRLDSRGALSTFTCDGLNRPTQAVHTKAGLATQTFTWTYDLRGQPYGNGAGHLGLSGMHRWGDLLPLNVELANHWLERVAEGGHGEAQHHLAWYHEFGQDDYALDNAAAESWYQRAFEQGHPETLYLFAIRQFKDGKPTEPALELLRKAADKGFKQAEHVLRSVTH